MSLSPPDAVYREAAASLTPTAVSQYLAATKPWQLESRLDHVKEVWSLPDRSGRITGRILLPLATDYADFSERFYDALSPDLSEGLWLPLACQAGRFLDLDSRPGV
jgi:hypothetical protein